MIFIIKGELLVNSQEYPGTSLHSGQFILQAIGSKIEILALTEVEYIVYWFNQLPQICEDRYREILNGAEAPLTYTPLMMNSRLNNLIVGLSEYLAEGISCGPFIELKCQELVFLLIHNSPVSSILSVPILKVSNISLCKIMEKSKM